MIPFRAIEILPGVTPVASGVPFFFVRGAPPGNVGYFFDEIAVPGLFHVGAGPAVIHPAFIEEVKLYAGSFPVHYGRFSGGILAGSLARPKGRLRGEANLRLVDSGAFVEVPFDQGRGNLMAAGRYSYTGAMVSLLAQDVEIGYWDYQARATQMLSDKDSLSLLGFGAYDFLSAVDDDGLLRDLYDVTFHRYNLRFQRALSRTSAMKLSTTLGFDRTAGGDGRLLAEAMSVRNRAMLSKRVSERSRYRLGGDVQMAFYEITLNRFSDDSPDGPPTLDPRPLPGLPPRIGHTPSNLGEQRARFASRNDAALGAFVDWEWRANPRLTVTPGIRFDLYVADGTVRLAPEPRVSARFQVLEHLALLHDLGVAHQPPSFAVPVPGFNGTPKEGLQTGVLSSAGAELELGDGVSSSFTLFQNVVLGRDRPTGSLSAPTSRS